MKKLTKTQISVLDKIKHSPNGLPLINVHNSTGNYRVIIEKLSR